MVSPQQKRLGVKHLLATLSISERHSCEVVGISRTGYRYQAKGTDDEAKLRVETRQLVEQNGAYGYKRVTQLLRRQGWSVNKKRVFRIWQEEGLQQPRRKPRKRSFGPRGEVKQRAQYPNHVWSYDFVEDRTEKGQRLRMLCVIDEFTRECLAIEVASSISSAKVIEVLEWLVLSRGIPQHIRSDNGPEFVAIAVRTWLAKQGCQTIFITPGSPWENPFIESFLGSFRRECLDRYLFSDGHQAREIVVHWRQEYNEYRPHSSLGYRTPAEYARQQADAGGSAATRPLDLNKLVIFSLNVVLRP